MITRFYQWNDQPVTAAEFAELVADLFAQGWVLSRPDGEKPVYEWKKP